MNSLKKAVFLDRDGVLNLEIGDYIKTLNQFEILPWVGEALKHWKAQGFVFVVVTNQGGLAKGLYTVDTLNQMHQKLAEYLLPFEVEILAYYFSPHHPDYGNSLSRKPGSLMLEKAAARFNINLQQSWLIGDKDRDIQAAEALGVKAIKIEPNYDLRKITLY